MSSALGSTPLAALGIEGLVNPALAAGALLASVPLIIHLLNRRNHTPLDWAAMRFARAAWKKIRRRTRFENLLLLLLRMAAIALLALALARPFATGGGPLSTLTENHRDLVLMIDGSASMDYRLSLTRVWDETLVRARDLVDELDGASGDRVHLYLCGTTPRLLSDRTPEEASLLLGTLEDPLAESFDLEVALQRAIDDLDKRQETDPGAIQELVLLTDAQRSVFLNETGATANNSLDLLTERELSLRVEDIHTRATGRFQADPANLGISELFALDPFGARIPALGAAPTLRSGSAAGFQVTVTNSGTERKNMRVAIEVNGERKTAKRIEVPAKGKADTRLDVNLLEPSDTGAQSGAYHSIEVVLESDSLSIDDRRAIVVFAPTTIGVLVINGDPRPTLADDEVAFLLAGMTPNLDGPGTAAAPFDVTSLTADAFAIAMANDSLNLADFPVIWLANVENPSPDWVTKVEDHVASGATLVMSLGDRVTAERYNERLGGGLLPVTLLERQAVASRRESFWTPRIEVPDHPALAFFADERFEVFFNEVPFFEFFGSTPREGSRVLSTLDDQGPGRPGSPLFVERSYGDGRSVLWTSTIDSAWNLFAESPASLIPLTHEIVFGAARPIGPSRNLAVGETLSADFDFFPESPTMIRPDGSSTGITSEAVAMDAGGREAWHLEGAAKPNLPGVWSLRTGSGTSDAYAVALAPGESNLERISAAELEGLHPALLVAKMADEDASPSSQGRGGELWRGILMLVLACLVGEALWSGHLDKRSPRSVRSNGGAA